MIITGCETFIQELQNFGKDAAKYIKESVSNNDNKESLNEPEKPSSSSKINRTEILNSDFNKYKIINDQEERYLQYKDNDSVLFTKVEMLKYINSSRVRYNVPKLELDILACRVANKMSSEAAHNNFVGHWNLRGEKPYHRYAVAGGVDHDSENAAASWSSNNFLNNSTSALKLMKEAHNSFMAETPPNDGHKKNVINKNHNFVGIGYKIEGNQFRYYEEYIDRYLSITTKDIFLKNGMSAIFSFKSLSNNLYPYSIIVYYEPPLEQLTPAEINKRGAYPDFSRNIYLEMWPWDLPRKDKNGYFTVSFPVHKKGSFYVNIYLSDKPYSKSSNVTTVGKIQASGVVFFAN